MDIQQNPTKLTPQQERFINFVASGQLNLDLKKQSYQEFAQSLGVDRSTLYSWRRTIPDFWVIVAERTNAIVDKRIPKIMNAMFAKAMRGDVNAAKLLLNQAGRLKPKPELSFEDRTPLDELDLHSLVARAMGVDELPGPEIF